MEILVDFPGGARVDAHFSDGQSASFTVRTDQPAHAGGDGSAPSPFATFLASIATCAGYYVLSFCQKRGLPTDGLRIVQHVDVDRSTGHVTTIRIDIDVPPTVPEKYRDAIVRAAEQCAVKKHFEHLPQFEIRTHPVELTPA
jgi:putative redox protein